MDAIRAKNIALATAMGQDLTVGEPGTITKGSLHAAGPDFFNDHTAKAWLLEFLAADDQRWHDFTVKLQFVEQWPLVPHLEEVMRDCLLASPEQVAEAAFKSLGLTIEEGKAE